MQNENETLIIDPESDYLQGIMFDFRKAFHSDAYDACSKCLMAAQHLARTLDEKHYAARLVEIRDGVKTGMSVSYLEYFILKSVRSQSKLFKVRLNDNDYTLGNLNELLLKAKEETYLIFGDMQKKHNLKPKMDWLGAIEKGARVSFDDLKI